LIRVLSIQPRLNSHQTADYGQYEVLIEVDGIQYNLEYTCDFRLEDGFNVQLVTWKPEDSILTKRNAVDISGVMMVTDTVVEYHRTRFAPEDKQ